MASLSIDRSPDLVRLLRHGDDNPDMVPPIW